MTASAFRRPPFIADGRIVARREVTLGKVYQADDELPAEAISPSQLATFWNQGLVDTLPREPKPTGKSASSNQRR